MNLIEYNEILPTILDRVKDCKNELLICSAWITAGGIRDVLEKLYRSSNRPSIKVLLRASEPKDFEITEHEVFNILNYYKIYFDISVAFHSHLHAKFIVIDDKYAIIGSANLTESGLKGYNVEAAMLIEDKESVRKLREYFYKIWNNEMRGNVIHLNDEIVGFVSNPGRSNSIEVFLLDPHVCEGAFLIFHYDGKKYLAKVEEILSWNTNFFLNPFTQGFENPLFPKPQEFSFIFDHEKPKEWQIGALLTRLRGKDILTAKAKVLGYFDGGKLKLSLSPIRVGVPVMLAKAEDIYQTRGVKIGRVPNANLDVYLDIEEVRTKHMAVLGTTGSGKSYFVKLFITRVVNSLNKIFVLDPHGEYSNHFRELFKFNDFVEVKIPSTVLFFDHEKLMDFLKLYGVCFPHSSSNAYSEIQSKIAESVTSCKCLSDIIKEIEEILDKDNKYKHLKNYLKAARIAIEDEFGLGAFKNQKDVLNVIDEAIKNSTNKVVIFNLKDVDNPVVRSEIAGYILKELFKVGKSSRDFKSVLVLEEAHNFAPERGYGEVSAGRENLSKVYAEKIASEGRKFGLGLIVVSQRPAQVSKFVLSQTNTQALFKIINDNDLKAIEQSIESVSRNIIDKLPDLKTGYAFVTGTGIEIPTLVEVA